MNEVSIFVPKSSIAERYREVFGMKMRTYAIQLAGSFRPWLADFK